MTIDALLDAVRARGDNPVDAREADSVRQVLELVPVLDDPFDETKGTIHFTGSALITGPRGIVLHKHRRLGIWLQPGGHVDPGETPAEAATRESAEETGLPITLVNDELIHVDVHQGGKGHTHLDLRYLCSAPDIDPTPPPAESQEVFWFSWDAAIELADAGLRGLLIARRPSPT